MSDTSPRHTAGPFETDLRRYPVYRLYARLYEERASGHLHLRRGKAHRHIVFVDGFIRFASSNLRNENAGGMQLERGEIDQATFDSVVEYARTRKATFTEALFGTKALPYDLLEKALAEQVAAVATGALGWPDGTAKFEPDPHGAARMPDYSRNPLLLVLEGTRRLYPIEKVRPFLQARGKERLESTPALERELEVLRSARQDERITASIRAGKTVEQIMSSATDEDILLLFCLMGTGLARIADRSAVKRASHKPSAAGTKSTVGRSPGPAPARPEKRTVEAANAGRNRPPTTRTETQDDARISDEIEAEHQRVADATPYEVLGLSPSADESAVQRAYLRSAKKWHIDRFVRYSLGETTKTLNLIFARIVEAREILADPQRRAEYDVFLDRKAKGLPTDIEAILRAEELFQQGEKLMKAGRAAAALERFEAAVALNEAEAEPHAWRGYARYVTTGKQSSAQARADIDRALHADPDMPAANYFLGMIALDDGDSSEAERRFQRALASDPRHLEARRQLNRLRASSG